MSDRLWVKVCGTTTLADARLAVEAGADALGFVFAQGSPRQVTVGAVAAITAGLAGAEVERVGVFVGSAVDEIAAAVREAGLTGVQLHEEWDPRRAVELRERLGAEVKLLQVVHYRAGLAEALRAVASSAAAGALDGVLVDSRSGAAAGGTGLRFDWVAARVALGELGGLPVVVAGGLDPENVGEAVCVLRPRGVDVVSGVEARPGCKDGERVRAFVRAARAG